MRTVILLIIFEIATMLLVRCDMVEANFRSGSVERSPNGKFECFASNQEEGGVNLFIRLVSDAPSAKHLWSTIRSLGIAWSPNSRWLAVMDHYLASESAVLIFDCQQEGYPLVYQTPISKTEQDSWDVVGWDVDKKQVILERNRRFSSNPPLKVAVKLKTSPIKATLYQDD